MTSKAERPQVATFILLVAELAVLLYLAQVFLIEQNYGFTELIPVVLVGFVVHAWLPLNWRGPFFVLLFPVSTVILLGPAPAAVLLCLGTALFLICHLPVSIRLRAAILIATGFALAAVRAGMVELTIPGIRVQLQTQTLPIVGAIFMFRTAVYLYDLRHERGPVSIWQRLGYFFLFPNVCFPLFPVVDYQTWKRTYYDRAAFEIYQKGIDWIFRGIVHLLLYRIVYHYFVPDPLEIQGLAGVAQYALSSFLLYLRVSGLFHLIIGILCLFGFDLPETHHRYYLAESFTDFWRRINIYWKDFMMKLFYFPIYLSLRRWGLTLAMILATLTTFLITWALHSYQWFWLRGTFTLHPQDMIFWGVLAVLVTVNSLYEEKYGRKRRSLTRQEDVSVPDALKRSVKTVAVFVIICLLWSFWTSSSIDQWLDVMSVAGSATTNEILVSLLLLAAVIAGGVLLQLLSERYVAPFKRDRSAIVYRAAWVGTGAVALLAIASPLVNSRLSPEVANVVATISGDKLNTRDEQQLVKGYYEGLLGAGSAGAIAWTIRLEEPDTWRWDGKLAADFEVATDDIRQAVLRPSIDTIHKRQEFRTNRWGMRDKDYAKAKPPGTFRIAMLGSSHTEGAGVAVSATFPALLEERLNGGDDRSSVRHVEILNFAAAGNSILARVARLQRQALEFHVDAVIDMSITGEGYLAIRQLRNAVLRETPDLDPFLRQVILRAAVTPDMSSDEIERRLGPYGEEIIAWGYRELARIARQNGLRTLVVLLPKVDGTDAVYREEWRRLSDIAHEVGLTIVNIGNVYGPIDERESLKLASWDLHPNAEAHAMVTQRLYEELAAREFLRPPDKDFGRSITGTSRNFKNGEQQ